MGYSQKEKITPLQNIDKRKKAPIHLLYKICKYLNINSIF